MYLDSDKTKPIERTTSRGTVFKAARADLACVVEVTPSQKMDTATWLAECTEFAAWHAHFIHPTLNGFAGYDTVEYKILPNSNETLVREKV